MVTTALIQVEVINSARQKLKEANLFSDNRVLKKKAKVDFSCLFLAITYNFQI